MSDLEFKCDRCNGDGAIQIDFTSAGFVTCPICLGKGAVDWVQHVMQRDLIKNKTYLSFSESELVSTVYPFQDKIIKKLSERMAKDIDRQILELLNGVKKEAMD